MKRLLVIASAVAVGVATASAQHSKLFDPTKLAELEGPDREAWQRPDQIMDALAIGERSVVADLGAGGGWFTVHLAQRVGPNGRVYAEDIQPEMMQAIDASRAAAQIAQRQIRCLERRSIHGCRRARSMRR